MKNNKRIAIYFEIRILLFITLGPIDPLEQIPFYVVLIILNLRFFSSLKRVPIFIILIIFFIIISYRFWHSKNFFCFGGANEKKRSF